MYSKWKTKRSQIDKQGTAILDALMQATSTGEKKGQTTPGMDACSKCFEMLQKSYDAEYGGFTETAPKFPQPGKTLLNIVECRFPIFKSFKMDNIPLKLNVFYIYYLSTPHR